MARPPRFRDRLGRFRRRDYVEEFGGTVEIVSDDNRTAVTQEYTEWARPQEPEPEPEPMWATEASGDAIIWRDFVDATPDTLSGFEPPMGATHYKVIVDIDFDESETVNDPSRKTGHFGSIWLRLSDGFNPSLDMFQDGKGSRFHAIYFH